ncbi:PREDICTED: transcription initiation factor TFIID subunit 2 [Tarenaya hassleriana]|uniref:transcription initiation factor TFIID subunit 2 n=1 Tax=Tarenaya hassleriana TaxID=28532 RepID=UPI00053C7B8C|nr:PREDICTED: transcription initiation factor TFIID subunit 2 [Tarenaya hassleriana]XP_019057968.1 PREDICTED: transcription initiation factor TFIID subunit 2 [Tarenaya hassleriana]
MAKARKPKSDEAPAAKPAENTGAKVRHQKLCLSIDFDKRQIYGYTELEVTVPDIGIVGLHAENLGIESVLVDGEPTVFEYYPHHQNPENESRWSSVSDPASAADAATVEYVGVLRREDTENLLINCCKPSKALTEQLECPQSSGEAKQNVKLIRINYWVEKTESGVQFNENIVHTDNQLRRARCWFPCIDDEYHRCSFDLEFTVPHNFVAVSVGKLLYQVMCKDDPTRKTYVYKLNFPISPRWMSLVAGPFEVLPDHGNHFISNVCLPSDLSRLRNTVEFFHEAYSYYEDYLSAEFPFGFYKQVFLPPEMVVSSSNWGASLSVFSSQLIYDERVIDQIIETRIKLASALARQWFGVYITPESPNDEWLLDGLAGFLTDMFTKKFLGNNEARYRRFKANCIVCKADDSGAMCLSSSASCKDLFGTHSIGMHGKIRSWKSVAVLQMLEKQMGPESFRKILQKIVSRAKDPTNAIRSLSTKEFRHSANKIGNLERPFLKEFFQRWVASCGCPVLRIGFSYNKRKNIVEMAALRECTASLDARLSVINANPDLENRDMDVGWPGIMSIRFYELDVMSDHPKLPMAGDKWQLLELPCHSKLAAKRYQKPKKGLKPDILDDNVDALDNRTSIESPLSWIRADPEIEYIAEVHLHQPLQMWINQLEKDGDVVAQAQAIAALEALQHHQSFSIMNALNNILIESKVFWRIRVEAAFALAKTASEETDLAGLQHLIKFYKSRRFDAEIGLPKPNDFRDFPEYFVLKAIPHAIAIVRGGDGKSPREAVEFILQLVKYNDNSGNPYSDAFWLAELVQSVGNLEFGQQTLTFLAPLLKRIDRILQFDRLMPSYNGILTISCIRTLAQIALNLSDFINLEDVCKLIEPFQNFGILLQVRMEASRALLNIEYHSRGISSALTLFKKYVVEEPSLRGQVKLCIHAMRLCQIAVGPDSDENVDSVSLLGLLQLLESRVAFNNEFFRHHLFCIFQILAGRPPTLFGVPKEKSLQLVVMETCIEPKSIFAVPAPEIGDTAPLAIADTEGKSLDLAAFGFAMRPPDLTVAVVPEIKLPESVVVSCSDIQQLGPPMENRDQPLRDRPITLEVPSTVEAPTEEIAQREPVASKEPDLASVSVSHEIKKPVIRIRVRPSGATSRAEVEGRSVDRSQGVMRHDMDRGATSSASVDAPQRISADAVSASNQNNLEEVNSSHDLGSRMTASIGSVKLAGEGDNFGKELQCTAESGKYSASLKPGNQLLSLEHNMDPEAQKYASLQTLSSGKEKEKKKDKEKKEREKKRKRKDPEYIEKKRLKKEKKQKEKELAKLMSSSSTLPTKRTDHIGSNRETAETKAEEQSGVIVAKKVETKPEPSSSEARPPSRFRIKLKSKALNNT